jgi:hypothetical protein
LLTTRDLKVRYSTSALGYLWSIVDPLVMAGIYWFVFTQVFNRGDAIGEEPYIVFLLAALPAVDVVQRRVSDTTRRTCANPSSSGRRRSRARSGWRGSCCRRASSSSHPSRAHRASRSSRGRRCIWQAVYFLLGIVLQAVLTMGVGLIVAPLVVFFRDLERATKLALRFLFYASRSSTASRTSRPACTSGRRSTRSPASSGSTAPRSSRPARLVRGGDRCGHERRHPRGRHPRLHAHRARRAEGDLVAAQGSTDGPIGAIEVRDAGIRFRRNRRSRRNFKDLFAGRSRRARANEFWALRNITFSVSPGEAIGVRRAQRPGQVDAAQARGGGHPPRRGHGRRARRCRSLIEITGGFVDDLTVRDNVFLTAGLHGMTRREIEERFDEIIDFAEIPDFLDTPTSTCRAA